MLKALVLTSAVVLSTACEKRQAPTPTQTPPSAPAPDAVYTVRGKVVELPDPANPTKEFRLHHEAIPTFKAPEGKVVGMHEMEMPFPVSDAKLLEGIQVGDLVEITFADWYKPVRTYKVTKVTKLPADTKLNLKD
jgi:Cu/Ag efflux protein CusF